MVPQLPVEGAKHKAQDHGDEEAHPSICRAQVWRPCHKSREASKHCCTPSTVCRADEVGHVQCSGSCCRALDSDKLQAPRVLLDAVGKAPQHACNSRRALAAKIPAHSWGFASR